MKKVVYCIAICSLVSLLFSCSLSKKNRIPGDIHNFDPLTRMYEILGDLNEQDYFLQVSASYVKPDGTIDIEADYVKEAYPVTTYKIVRFTENEPFEPLRQVLLQKTR